MLLEVVVSAALVPLPHVSTEQVAGNRRCVTRACRTEQRWRRVVRPYRSHFESIARCESTSRWHLSTGNGFFGGLQFTLSSWRYVGGGGYPHHATKLEQMYRGVLLMRRQGWGAWPNCA